jgi:hypothetical protein
VDNCPFFWFSSYSIQPHFAKCQKVRLAVRNLLRGYLLRLSTRQAVARELRQRLQGVCNIPVLTEQQIRDAAASAEQVQVLRDAKFLVRTPLWYYILAEAASLEGETGNGRWAARVVAKVLVGLVRRSEGSILRQAHSRSRIC